MNDKIGTLLIVSGPSGSGKTTLCRRAEAAGLTSYSISCTTRAPRPGEKDGQDYYFLTQEDFATKVASGEFLEHATVHGNSYGTLLEHVKSKIQHGINVVMDIDVQGAAAIRSNPDPLIRRAYADVFIHVPDAELEARLRGRETDSEEVIALRLNNAKEENMRQSEYEYILVSSDRESDYCSYTSLLSSLSMRVSLMT